ncbi:MAG TPA: SRPBCC family protein [Actinomycetes bacterium]|nr:SRPBCC family protein [Actinomycetes bacterium]
MSATTDQEKTSEQQSPEQEGGGTFAKLTDAVRDYVTAKGSGTVKGLGDKLSGLTHSLEKTADTGGFKAAAAGKTAEKMAEGESAPKAALTGVASGVKKKVGGIFGGGDKDGGGKKKLPTSIVEDIFVGVPVDVAYNQWTQFQELPSYAKGPQSVEQKDDATSRWVAKIGLSTREWTTTIQEQVPERRIAWSSEGDKGTVDGVITFHPLADDLTLLLLVLEYQPKGFVEWMGNRWRVVGRRARLDLKHYRRFVMMSGDATGAWRGEIREGEVVPAGDEADQDGRAQPKERAEKTQQQTDEPERPGQEQKGQEGRQVPQQGEGQEAGAEEEKATSPLM